jgi:polar amino acid transport system ATP-binding protein
MVIKVKNINKSFDGIKILNDISMDIVDVAIVGLAGESGGGKTTLLRCIQGLETVDSGSIECDRRACFMFQDFQLFPHMTVIKNVTYAPVLKDKSKKSDYKSQAMDILQALGIRDKAFEYPKTLSGGQKQRVALARSLMIRPEVLLCDEPTSGLDILTTAGVISLLRSVRDMGIAIIIASHDLDFLTSISDRVVLLKKGSIAVDVCISKCNDPKDLLKRHY